MSKNNKNVQNIATEQETADVEVLDQNEVEVPEVVKPKWSLKKKLLIGGGILAGLILGAVALGMKKSDKPTDDEVEESEDDCTVINPDADTDSSDETPADTAETAE